jgi:hypothetical protein
VKNPDKKRHWPNRAPFTGRFPPLAEKPFPWTILPCILKLFLQHGGKVNSQNSYEWRKQILWGLILIGVGSLFFFDRYGMFEIDDLWHYWPLLMIPIGLNKMIPPTTAAHFTSGVWLVFFGLWLYANFEHLFGLTFRNSWPFLLIAWGIALVVGPLVSPCNKEPRNEA